jgi:hypothetical protein
MSRKVYIAGPIESAGGNMNEPLFDFVAQRLREQGCEVMNPWDLTRELVGSLAVIQAMSKEERRANRRGLLAKELVWIINNATEVLMLPEWEKSPGARAENAVALALEIPVFEAPNTLLPAFQQRQESKKAAVDAVVIGVK